MFFIDHSNSIYKKFRNPILPGIEHITYEDIMKVVYCEYDYKPKEFILLDIYEDEITLTEEQARKCDYFQENSGILTVYVSGKMFDESYHRWETNLENKNDKGEVLFISFRLILDSKRILQEWIEEGCPRKWRR